MTEEFDTRVSLAEYMNTKRVLGDGLIEVCGELSVALDEIALLKLKIEENAKAYTRLLHEG